VGARASGRRPWRHNTLSQSFKTCLGLKFKPNYATKFLFFRKKSTKIAVVSSVPPPETPFVSGGWGFRASASKSRIVTHVCYYNFVEFFLALNAFYFYRNKAILYFFFFRTFAPVFHFKICSYCWRGRKNISCPRAQGTVAAPLEGKLHKS